MLPQSIFNVQQIPHDLTFMSHTRYCIQRRLNKLHDLQEPVMRTDPSALVHASCLSLGPTNIGSQTSRLLRMLTDEGMRPCFWILNESGTRSIDVTIIVTQTLDQPLRPLRLPTLIYRLKLPRQALQDRDGSTRHRHSHRLQRGMAPTLGSEEVIRQTFRAQLKA